MNEPTKRLSTVLAKRRKSSLAEAIATDEGAGSAAGSFQPPSPADSFLGRHEPRGERNQPRSPDGEQSAATAGRAAASLKSTRRPDRTTTSAAILFDDDSDPGRRFNLNLKGRLLQDVLVASAEMRRIPTKAITILLAEALEARRQR